jgi:hypothetical protein
MPFVKNDLRINRNGRPKGIQNKTSSELKEMLQSIFEFNVQVINDNLNHLTLTDRINFNKILLPYLLPRLNNVSISSQELLSEEEKELQTIKNSIENLSYDELKSLVSNFD